MLTSVADSLRSVASNAFSNLVTPVDRNGPTPISKEITDRPAHGTRNSLTRSPDQTDLMSGRTKTYTQSVPRFLNEAEAQVEESLKEQQQETESNTRSEQQTSPPQLRTARHTLRRRSARSDEKRALGIPEPSPPDATLISAPMPRTSFLQGRLQPCNTLNQTRSGRADFYIEKTHKVNPVLQMLDRESRSERKKPKSQRIHENNHEQPNKRLRIGPEHMTGSSRSSAINLDDSQDSVSMDQPVTHLLSGSNFHQEAELVGGLVRTFNGHSITSSPRTEQGDVKMMGNPTSPSSDSKHITRSRDPHTPDELGVEDFTKTARRQRLQDSEDEAEEWKNSQHAKDKTHLDRLLASSSPVVSSLPHSTPRRSTSSAMTQTRPVSRVQQRIQALGDSPDALQGECTTSATMPTNQEQRARVLRRSSDAHPTESRKKKTASAKSGPKQSVVVFPVIDYVVYNVPVGKEMALFVNTTLGTLSLGFLVPQLDVGHVFDVTVASILKFYHDPDGEQSRVMLLTNNSVPLRKLCFELSPNLHPVEFRDVLRTVNSAIETQERVSRWMADAFATCSKEMAEYAQSNMSRNRQVQANPAMAPAIKKGNYHPDGQTGVRRARLTDNLDSSAMTVISGADRAGENQATDDSKSLGKVAHPASEVAKQPTTPSRVSRNPTRATRSHNNKAEVSYDDTPGPIARASIFAKLKRWKKPLVYPLDGKKRETVQFDDLQRLDDEEFLNDNLVCLFIRYLEEHADEKMIRKMHFFNSFLFEALTKDAKARREINFDAVKRWTTKVDLFSRDFVVVPVNENLHWFVMIICNLSYFRRKHAPRKEDDEDHAGIIHSIQSAAELVPEVILRSDLEAEEASTRSSFAEMNLDDQNTSNSGDTTAAKTTFRNRLHRKPRKSLQKYDVDKPTIITLDSLDQSRSATASLLRQYIVAEALDKKGWEIDGNEIKGMTAKGIPHQDNFSDCGLYLCMYLEQFILDPYTFVHSILQRTDGARWPPKIESSDLRDRLRNMLLNLHERQTSQETQESRIPPLGSILVQMRNLAQDDDPRSSNLDKVRAAKKRWNVLRDRDEENARNRTEFEEPKIQSLDDWRQTVNDTIEINDNDNDNDQAEMEKTDTVSHYFSASTRTTNPRTRQADSSTISHSSPGALAKRLREQRSPEREVTGVPIRSFKSPTTPTTERYDLMDQNNTAVMSRAPVQPTMSPLQKSNRKAHQKFKRSSDSAPLLTIDIEDDELRDSSDHEAALVFREGSLISHSNQDIEVQTNQKPKKRKAMMEVTERGDNGATTTGEHTDNPEMLLTHNA